MKRLLIGSVLGVVLGIALLILSKLMLTKVALSSAETNRSSIVNDVGRIVLIVSILTATFCYTKVLVRLLR